MESAALERRLFAQRGLGIAPFDGPGPPVPVAAFAGVLSRVGLGPSAFLRKDVATEARSHGPKRVLQRRRRRTPPPKGNK